MNFDLLSTDDTASLESLKPYPQFYRQLGIRLAMQLAAPIFHSIEKLDLPLGTVIHHIPEDESAYGIAADDPLLAGATRITMVEHVQKLTGDLGQPKSTNLPAGKMIRDYHRKYRTTRLCVKRDLALREPRTVLVVNYGLLNHLWRYNTSALRHYFKWRNVYKTFWDGVAEVCAATDRPQYIRVRMPTQLPLLSKLREAERTDEMTRERLKYFREVESLEFLELWRWMGEHRQHSMISAIPEDKLDNINLILQEGDRWTIVTLGHLNQWRKSEANPKGVLAPKQLQMRFAKLAMSLIDTRAVPEDEDPKAGQVITDAPQEQSPVVTDAEGQVTEDPKPAAKKVENKPLVITVAEAPTDTEEQTETVTPAKPKTIKLGKKTEWDELNDQQLESEENIAKVEESIERELALMEERRKQTEDTSVAEEGVLNANTAMTNDPVVSWVPEPATLENGVMRKADQLADAGLISGPEYRRFTTISSAYKKLPDPYGAEGKTLADRIVVDPQALILEPKPLMPNTDGIIDKSLTESTLEDFSSRYVRDVMGADITGMVLNLQHAGVAVTSYTVEKKADAFNAYEEHTVQLTPVQGKSSIVRFRVPVVKPDGTYQANGVRYRLRTQRVDVPIRKISPTRVSLTSYYSRVAVTRSDKQVHNYAGWLCNRVIQLAMSQEETRVTNLMQSNVYDPNNRVPRTYSILAQRFRSFQIEDLKFFLHYEARIKQFGEERVSKAEADNQVVIGASGKRLLVVDNHGIISYFDETAGLEEIGTIESILGLEDMGPMEVTMIRIFNKTIPLGVMLAYHMGIDTLCEQLRLIPRRVPTGERLNIQSHEFALRFENEALVFSRDNKMAEMLLGGFVQFEKSLRNYSSHMFNRQEIYLNVFEQNKLGQRYLREFDMMTELFVDPVTRQILEDMKEPTDFIGLMFRSNQLLLSDWSPDETDMQYQRLRGYERFAGAVYGELIKSLRVQRSRGAVNNAKIDVAPHAVWKALQEDSAVKLVEESNPVHNMREKEEVTFSGTGGRSSRTMVGRTRVFHKNDMAVISESTKDSADVSITTFMTANPKITSLRGITGVWDPEEDGAGRLMSSPALLSPASDRDDPKRVNFVAIQHSSSTFAKGYTPSPIRTGYEQVVAHRTDDLFAFTAKRPGRITALTPRSITVTYDDGETHSVQLGRRFGTVSGMTLPHEVVAAVRVGDVIEEGQIVAYNSHYFQLDPLNKKQVLWKAGVLLKTAILESSDTLEDSSAISERASELLSTSITSIRNVMVSFDQVVHNVLSDGTNVEADSILCTIEDAITAQGQMFDTETLDTLRLLSANTPKAKQAGVVEKVEVFYNGDPEDLSESLKDLAMRSDRERRRMARDLNEPYTSGRVMEGLRIDGKQLPPNHVVIRFYITGTVKAGVGGKGVFANQMKTVVGRVMAGTNETERGEPLDAFFGLTSIEARIVGSPFIIGTTITLMKEINQRFARAYRGK